MKKKGKKQMYPQIRNFNKEQQDLAEMILEQIENQDSFDGLKTINDVLLNAIMKKERDIFVRKDPENKGNGFYQRSLMSALGRIDLEIPRDRLNEFRPFLLPEKWQRGEQSYDDLIKSLIIHSYSPNKIRSILKSLGLSYCSDEIDEIKEEIYQRSQDLKNKQLPAETFCIYIDAYHTSIKDPDSKKVTDAVIHCVIGVNKDGQKSIFGYYEFFGSENKEHWLIVLNDLIHRGMIKPALIISDDFPGLKEAVAILFDKTDHQLCFIHMQRNVRKNMSKSDAKEFNDTLKTLKTFKDFDKAVNDFEKLALKFKKKYPHFIDLLIQKKNLYFAFLKYPEGLRKHIYTTNTVESFNSRLEVMRINLGGYFQSTKTLNLAVQVLVDKLQSNIWKKKILAFRAHEYEIYQLFRTRFLS